jgi:hypothetical protein
MKKYSFFNILSLALFLAGVASVGGAYYFYTMTVRTQEVLVQLIDDSLTGSTREGKEARDREVLRTTEGERLVLAKIVSADMVTLLKRIETIGVQTKTSIAIESVTPENVHPKDPTLKGATVRMVGTGSFAAILQAQEALSYLPAAVTIQSYTLDKQDEGWKFTTTLKIYTKDKKTAQAVPLPSKTQ